MVAAAYNYETVLEELKLAINDRDSANQWMTDTWYKSKIFEHFITNKQTTYTFTQRATGVWTYYADGYKVYFYDMSFTGVDDATYTVNCTGSIELTAGIDSTTNHTVSGTEVNFPELIVDVCQYLITHKAQSESVNIGGASITPMDEDRLIKIMETWRGMIAL